MKSREESKKNLESSLFRKVTACILAVMLPLASFASPTFHGGTAVFIDDQQLLDKIGLPGSVAFCYDEKANTTLITAPSFAKEKCDLHWGFEMEKQRAAHALEVGKLQIRVDTLGKQNEEIIKIKDEEILRLTDAALKRPNEYSVWWATGGFIVGSLATIAIVLAVSHE